MAKKVKLEMIKGTTFPFKLRWALPVKSYAPIQTIQNSAPCQVGATAHNIPDGWVVWIEGAKGLTKLNAIDPANIQEPDMYRVTRIDANTVKLNNVNAIDLGTHIANTGVLAYYTPEDLTGIEVKMQLLDFDSGVLLDTFTHDDARKVAGTGFWVDEAARTITLEIAETVTKDYTFEKASFSIQVTTPGAVNKNRVICRGTIKMIVDETE